ncbi:MAG: Hpt domain-containing protein, partial [Gemmatimonadaceae bacterium]|nr:Hpt domain-containing protein [Gemmatimonadaceae bacterium]
AGMDGFLAKPFRREELLRELRRWLPEAVARVDVPTPTREVSTVPVASDSEAVIDDAAVANIRGFAGGDRIFRDAVRMLAGTMPERLARIATALETGDRTTVRTEAHALKSSTGMLGAQRLSAALRELEHAAPAAPPATLAALIGVVRSEATRAIEALQGVAGIAVAGAGVA